MKIIGFSQLHNELEKDNLENWFKCMLPICDYVYIYDQNSTDNSLSYYSKFKNVCVIKSNVNRFKEETVCKGELLEKIKIDHPDTDFIFWMDGDTLLDGRLLDNNGQSFRNLCISLKNDEYQGYLFGHKNLWRSDIYWRKDNLYNWLDENGVCALWKFTKDIFFPKVNGLHHRTYPNNINSVKMLPFILIHRGFSTDYQIITKFNIYKANGQEGDDLNRLLDESTLVVEKLSDGVLPKWFNIVDTMLPTQKQKIKGIYEKNMKKDNNNLNHMQNFWEPTHATDTYFDCGPNYEEDIRSRYGKFKHIDSEEALISMGLKHGVWGKAYNNSNCFRNIETECADWTILEIGCGYGGFGAMLAPFVKQYDGIDISSHIVNKGNEAISKCGIKNMCLIDAPESDLSKFSNSKYDMIFSTAVFIHTDRSITEHYLSETRRLLKSTGVFIHHINVTTERPLDIDYNKIYMVEDCEQMFNKAGLRILYQHDGIDFKSSPTAFMRYFCGSPINM